MERQNKPEAEKAIGIHTMPLRAFLLIFMALGYGFIAFCLALALSKNGLVTDDVPYGIDYTSFYAASRLILEGNPALVYNKTAHAAMQLLVFPTYQEYTFFFYPPIYMLFCMPMALLPYIYSIMLWLIITFVFCFIVLRNYAKKAVDSLALFGFGGTQITMLVGQNAFLTTGLMGAGLMLLEKRPLLAGLCFGLMAYKPHLGVILPFFLVATLQWQAFLAASLTVLLLIAGSLGIFGHETWLAFFNNAHSAVSALEEGKVGDEKMHSFFGAIRLLGGSLYLAYAVQICVALSAIVTVMRVSFMRREQLQSLIPLVATAPLLITPFVLNYDLMLLAIPLIWLFQEAQKSGYYPAERVLLLAGFLLPLFANTMTLDYSMPLAPLVIGGIFLAVLRRVISLHQKQIVTAFN